MGINRFKMPFIDHYNFRLKRDCKLFFLVTHSKKFMHLQTFKV